MRILFVTYNLALISNWIERLQPYMAECKFYCIHIGRLQNVKPKIVDGIEYYDISYCSYKNISHLLDEINPDKAIIFSFRSLYELFFQRLCVNKKIKQVYLEHGMFSQNTTHFKTSKLLQNFELTIKRQCYFLLICLELICNNENKIHELKILWNVYIRGKFNNSPFDHYYIYSKRSYYHFSKIYFLDKENVTYVGYPIFSDKTQKELSEKSICLNGDVLLVHQPFIADGFTTISYEEEKDYFIKIARLIEKKYNKLIVLLHPRENLNMYKKRYENTGIEVIQSPNNFLCFANKSLIIGHYSTALLYALYFNKPTAIIDYPKTKMDYLFKECFVHAVNMEELIYKKFDVDVKTKEYFVGKVNTYEHIAEIIRKK